VKIASYLISFFLIGCAKPAELTKQPSKFVSFETVYECEAKFLYSYATSALVISDFYKSGEHTSSEEDSFSCNQTGDQNNILLVNSDFDETEFSVSRLAIKVESTLQYLSKSLDIDDCNNLELHLKLRDYAEKHISRHPEFSRLLMAKIDLQKAKICADRDLFISALKSVNSEITGLKNDIRKSYLVDNKYTSEKRHALLAAQSFFAINMIELSRTYGDEIKWPNTYDIILGPSQPNKVRQNSINIVYRNFYKSESPISIEENIGLWTQANLVKLYVADFYYEEEIGNFRKYADLNMPDFINCHAKRSLLTLEMMYEVKNADEFSKWCLEKLPTP
jgi:hypothetical protein